MTQEYVKELFEYRDGVLYNKIERANGKLKAGEPVGYLNNTGYYRLELSGRKYLVHRIIFLYHNGYMPREVDHKDGDKLNNRIDNLRAATHLQNMRNVAKPVTNKSGYKGVCWHKRDQVWRAQISVDNKKMDLGNFKTPEEAYEKYKQAALIHHKEFAHV